MTETRPFEPFTTSYSFTPLVVMEESLTKRASDDAFLKAMLKAIVEDDSMTTADRDAAFLDVIDRYLDGVRASALAKSFASASAGCPALDRPRRLRRCSLAEALIAAVAGEADQHGGKTDGEREASSQLDIRAEQQKQRRDEHSPPSSLRTRRAC
jgi:hypothetical protein